MYRCVTNIGMQYDVSEAQLEAMKEQAELVTEYEGHVVLTGIKGAVILVSPLHPHAPQGLTLENV